MLPSITFNEYSEMVANGGLPGVVAIVWRDPETHTTVLDEFDGGSAVANKLKHLLSELVYEAERNLNTPQRLNLKQGLKVDVVITRAQDRRLPAPTHTVKLQLSRSGAYPSMQEWAIVCRDWPYPVPEGIRPKETEYAGRCYLRANWPAPLKMFDGFLSQPAVAYGSSGGTATEKP